jgi:WYL domain
MSIWEEIRNKFVRPEVHSSHAARLSLAQPFDDEEEICSENSETEVDAIAGLAILIEYENVKGETATRLVTCRRLDLHGDKKYLFGFCHSKQNVRQFRIDRVKEIFDHRTGQSLGPVDAFFDRYTPDQIVKSPLGFGLSVRRRADFLCLLNALVFVARCDRDYHPLERATLEKLIARFWLRLDLPNNPDEEAVLSMADRLAPDGETFWVSLHRIAREPTLVKIMRETARDIIEADGFIAKEEFYWGSKLDQFFRDNA